MNNTTLAILADIYSPVLIFAVALTIWTQPCKTKGLRAIGIYMVGVYAIMLLDRLISLWPRVGLDYSTHTAFAVVCVWLLWRHSKPIAWRLCWPGTLVMYLALMRHLGYHTIADMLTTLAVMAGWMACYDAAFAEKCATKSDNSDSNQTPAYGHDRNPDHRR